MVLCRTIARRAQTSRHQPKQTGKPCRKEQNLYHSFRKRTDRHATIDIHNVITSPRAGFLSRCGMITEYHSTHIKPSPSRATSPAWACSFLGNITGRNIFPLGILAGTNMESTQRVSSANHAWKSGKPPRKANPVKIVL